MIIFITTLILIYIYYIYDYIKYYNYYNYFYPLWLIFVSIIFFSYFSMIYGRYKYYKVQTYINDNKQHIQFYDIIDLYYNFEYIGSVLVIDFNGEYLYDSKYNKYKWRNITYFKNRTFEERKRKEIYLKENEK